MSATLEPPKLTIQLTAFDDSLHLRAAAPGGEGKASAPLPATDLLAPFAEPDKVTLSILKTIGKTLSQTLFSGQAGQLAIDVLEAGRQANQPVQVELRFDADQLSLAQFPWELLMDESGQFLVRDGRVDLTRYINYPQPSPAFDISLADRPLLQLISTPPQLPFIFTGDLHLERLETLEHVSLEKLMFKLLIERLALWGVQFNGYGGLVKQCSRCETVNPPLAVTCIQCQASLADGRDVAALAFERNGTADWVPTKDFGEILFNAQVQLTLLLCSDFTKRDGQFLFSGLTPSVILAGVPAVIGMQYPVSNSFANLFLSSFYATLHRQNDVLAALRLARKISMRDAWYSPALYLRHQKVVKPDDAAIPAYLTRNIDTAVPAQAPAGASFLVRLWIRRPETLPLSDDQLRAELDIPAAVPVSTRKSEVDLKFEPVEGRKLRRGEVEVKLASHECEITPTGIKLFVDEDIDAPAAIFTVRATQVGNTSLIFSLWQDGGQISTITHNVEIVADQTTPADTFQSLSQVLLLGNVSQLPVPNNPDKVKQLLLECYSYLARLKEQQARMADHTPPYIPLEIEATEAKIAELKARLDELAPPPLPKSPELMPPVPSPPTEYETTWDTEAPTRSGGNLFPEDNSREAQEIESYRDEGTPKAAAPEDTGVFVPPARHVPPQPAPAPPPPPPLETGDLWQPSIPAPSTVYQGEKRSQPQGCAPALGNNTVFWIILVAAVALGLFVCVLAIAILLLV